MSGSALHFVRSLAGILPSATTARAATILLHLRDAPGEADYCQALIKATGMSPPSLSRAIDTLSAQGYVERVRRTDARTREIMVKLTHNGRRIACEIEDAFTTALLPPAPAQRGKVGA